MQAIVIKGKGFLESSRTKNDGLEIRKIVVSSTARLFECTGTYIVQSLLC